MRILVFGGGAIGSVLGGLLAKAGHDVTLLGRAWHLDAVRQRGLRVSGLWGEHRIRNLITATQPKELDLRANWDWVFVCVKAHQTAAAAEQIAALLGSQTLVCAFQNGLGNYEALTERIPPSRVALGRVIFGVEIEAGHVRVTVCADEVLIGAPSPKFPRAQAAQLAAALQASGIPCRATATILTAVWSKVIYNCALNGLATVLEVPYGKLLEHVQARAMMPAIVEEAYRAAKGHRIPLEPATAHAYVEQLFTRLIPDTAAHRPSMLRDVTSCRPTEIEALNGTIVRLAHAVGVEAPTNLLVTRLIHAKEWFSGVASAPRSSG